MEIGTGIGNSCFQDEALSGSNKNDKLRH